MKLRDVAPAEAVEPLAAILELQAHDVTASTTIRDPRQAVGRHVADSLSALELPFVRSALRIADLGSGAGWPGLALAAALPEAQVSLVESAIRHCRYLERALEVSGLANVTVVNARAEAWPEGVGVHDLVTARALGAAAGHSGVRGAAARRRRASRGLERRRLRRGDRRRCRGRRDPRPRAARDRRR